MSSRRSEDERSGHRRRRDADDRPTRTDDEHRSKRKKVDLEAQGIRQISATDFFERAAEFRLWLAEDREKRINELDSSEAHRLFEDRFCRKWNRGRLDPKFYEGVSNAAAVPATSAWTSTQPVAGPSRPVQGPQLGPSRPETLAELQDRREREREAAEEEKKLASAQRAKGRREDRDDERADRATGRDRLQEKRAEARSSNKAMAERKDDAGLEVSDDILMGGSDSLEAAIAARDRARGRGADFKRARNEEREAQLNEKRATFQQKESRTMDMLKQLAAARFG